MTDNKYIITRQIILIQTNLGRCRSDAHTDIGAHREGARHPRCDRVWYGGLQRHRSVVTVTGTKWPFVYLPLVIMPRNDIITSKYL